MLTAFDKALLNILQTGLPVDTRPYLTIAGQLGTDEQTVIEALGRLKAQGYIRRMGAFFDSAQMGFISTLAAVRVKTEDLPAVAQAINTYTGVTHNYEREGEYNLWFALTTPDQEAMEQILEEIGRMPGVQRLINLPATRKFKVSVEFNLA